MRPWSGMVAYLRQLSLFDAPEPPAPRTPVRTVPEPVPVPNGDGCFADLLQGPYARIRVRLNPRLHSSWRVTWERGGDGLRLEIPSLLSEASRETRLALLEWSLLVSRRGRKPAAERARRTELEHLVRRALQAPGGIHAHRRSARNARRAARLNPKGDFHDLDAAFAAVNTRYFGGALEARITWSARVGGLSTHSIAHDGEGRPYHLLSISRGYDDPEVTPAILGGVVYHECLHIAIPPRTEAGRRVVHGPDFRDRERQYEHYLEWRRWHREGLPRALRRVRRRLRG